MGGAAVAVAVGAGGTAAVAATDAEVVYVNDDAVEVEWDVVSGCVAAANEEDAVGAWVASEVSCCCVFCCTWSE